MCILGLPSSPIIFCYLLLLADSTSTNNSQLSSADQHFFWPLQFQPTTLTENSKPAPNNQNMQTLYTLHTENSNANPSSQLSVKAPSDKLNLNSSDQTETLQHQIHFNVHYVTNVRAHCTISIKS
ncbi:Hypothetical predicted protein [Podarcis lilfordi]|uniref:Uncharacterized protein n=1 Tax=Podarcis lilfordi TaxID=74358 RepID=A0AA35KKP7_9SAUR|nr:Hypothetical predicted protein [Podarcis lilfordi]